MREIPDDIMQAAHLCYREMWANHDLSVHEKRQDIAEIAKAILFERQRHAEVMEEVRKVLASSDDLLKRLMHVHVAPDECKDETVAECRRWFFDNGGTLACLADQFDATRALLSQLEER